MPARLRSKPTTRLTSRQRVELILGQLDQLPTLPAVATRLLAVTTSPESSVRDVVKVIESDATLTASLLRLVRRADIGVRGDVLTVERAVALLGFRAVRNLALSVHLFEMFSSAEDNERARLTRNGIWEHSLGVALAAEMIAERLGGSIAPGEAFVCGLLHDIGKIALDACMPKGYARVVERVERSGECICDVERALFGLDHTAAGKRLVSRWRLPTTVMECVWLHHQGFEGLPSSVRHPSLVRVIHLADQLVRRESIGFSGYQHVGEIDVLTTQIGLDGAGVPTIVAALPEQLEPFREYLGIDPEQDRREHSATLSSVNRALSRANADLLQSNRRLAARSAFLDALDAFTRRLDGNSGPAETCAAAAFCIREWIGAARTIAFYGTRDGHGLYVGLSCSQGKQTEPMVLEMERCAKEEEVLDRMSSPAVGSISPAEEDHHVLWQRAADHPIEHTLWILPLCRGEEHGFGAVMLDATEEHVAAYRSAGACDTLVRAITLALDSARARTEASWMTEELLDLNRRLSAAQKQLIHARSVSMIAAMSAGAAHELHNPLSVISGRAQMERDRSADPQTRKALQVIVEQVERASEIITDLMRYAKPDDPSPIAQRVGPLLEGLCQHWQHRWSLAADQITHCVQDEQLTVHADPDQLRALLDALVANAVEACPKESIRVQINSPSRASDETVRIVVSDNGSGMTREVLDHAFDPFFSSHPAGRGRGLGLSQAYRLADINGGRLRLESKPGEGTRATVELPVGRLDS